MKNKIIISITLVTAIVLVLNLISQDFFIRLDFSEDKQFTLNKATKDILNDLQEPVTVTAYFSDNLPPNIAKAKKDFKEMLIEYSNRSKGMLVYKFISPNENEEIEQEAMQAGIQPIMIDVREKDQMKQQKAYMGAIISMGDRQEVLAFIQPGASLEYTLSKTIKKLIVVDKPVVGLLQGHGEPGIQDIVQAYNELSVLYSVEPLTLSDTTSIPERVKTIAIIRPKDSIPTGHLQQLNTFLANGGSILVATGMTEANLQNASGALKTTGLESWLRSKSINIGDNVVTDASCTQIQVVQQHNGYQMVSSIAFPYIPVIKNFSEHAVAGGLEAIPMPFSSTIEFGANTGVKFSPLAFSSEKSNFETLPTYFNIQKEWTEADFTKKHLVVAAAFEGKIAGESSSKMIVIASSDFIINGRQGQQQQQLSPDNISFFANSIDWLADDTGLVGLRSKIVTSRPIDELSDATRASLKWMNFLLPIILVVAYGVFRMQWNRNIREKRKEEDYV